LTSKLKRYEMPVKKKLSTVMYTEPVGIITTSEGVVKSCLASPDCAENVLEDPKQLRWGQLC
jgi:hypothetical protein